MKANEKALSDALFVTLAREGQICERPVLGLSPPPYFCDSGQDCFLSNDETCLTPQKLSRFVDRFEISNDEGSNNVLS